jgi:transcriptional regulator with XRE-family HTH domain
MTQETVRKWLRGALSKSGKTQQEAADGAGMARDALNKVLNGKRDLTATEMLALSTTLGVSVPGSKPYINSQGILPTAAPVRGIVAPGVWRETGAVMKQDYIVPVVPEPRYATETQYALRYEGPGQNGFQYGDFLIFVPIFRTVPT